MACSGKGLFGDNDKNSVDASETANGFPEINFLPPVIQMAWDVGSTLTKVLEASSLGSIRSIDQSWPVNEIFGNRVI